MPLKMFVNLFSALSFAFTTSAWGFSTEVHTRFRIQALNETLKDVSAAKAEFSKHQFRNNDKKLLEFLTPEAMAHLKIRTVNDAIVIEGEKVAAVLQIEDDRLLLNGAPLKLSPDVSITQSLKNWALEYKKENTPSSAKFILNQLLPKASAQIDPVTLATAMTVASGDLANLATNLMTATIIADTGATAGAVGAISTGALAATVAGTIVLGVGFFLAVDCEIGKLGKERGNCYSKPLSWIGMNPRDRLYLQDIECKKGEISVSLESQTNHRAYRTMKFNESGLYQIEDASRPFQERVRTKTWVNTSENKAVFEAVKKEFAYYKQICDSSEKRQQFKSLVEAKKSERQIHTDQPSAAKLGNK